MKLKNLHLIISITIVLPVAVIYGISPGGVLKEIIQFKIDTVNLANILRAVMGLYIAMATFWLIGIVKSNFWVAATITNILFMGGLALGRIISILFDGLPSTVFLIGLIIEILLAGWGLINLKHYKKKNDLNPGGS